MLEVQATMRQAGLHSGGTKFPKNVFLHSEVHTLTIFSSTTFSLINYRPIEKSLTLSQ